MKSNYLCAAAVAVAMSLASTATWADIKDYVFESVAPEWKKGDDVVVAVRLTHKPSGRPVADAVIVRTRIDMAPDNMADMVSPVVAVPSKEPGVYAFKTDLPMAGRYMFSVAAKVQGEPETVIGKIILKAVR
jgi:hypothetical protein